MNQKDLAHTHHIKCGVFCITEDPSKLGSDYYKAYIAYIKLTQWASILDNPEHVKYSMNKLYWNAVDKTTGKSDDTTNYLLFIILSAVAVVLVVAVVLIIICIRRKRNSEDSTRNDTGGLTED